MCWGILDGSINFKEFCLTLIIKEIIIMEGMALKFIGAGLMAFGMLGAAIGVGNIFGSLLNAIARNPSASDQLQRMAFIGAGLAEAMGLFSFVIAMLLIFT